MKRAVYEAVSVDDSNRAQGLRPSRECGRADVGHGLSVPDATDTKGQGMGFFNWAAPMFRHADKRWTDEDVVIIAGWLKPGTGDLRAVLDVGGGTGADRHV